MMVPEASTRPSLRVTCEEPSVDDQRKKTATNFSFYLSRISSRMVMFNVSVL